MKKICCVVALTILATVPGCITAKESTSVTAKQPENIAHDSSCLRGDMDNCRIVFEKEKRGRVAFIGGSITASPGWRDLTCVMLKDRFPNTTLDFINAGVGGTNSTFASFRFEDDVFKNGPVDLLFLEFAVNDSGGIGAGNQRLLAMEGIIRHARRLNPNIDILMLYMADQDKVETYRKGEVPQVIQDHEKVAEHYGIPVVYLAKEITRRIDAGFFEWSQFSRDTCHPLGMGHVIYAECIEQVLDVAWKKKLRPNATPRAHELPPPLDPMNYEHAHFIPLEQAQVIKGWNRLPQWDTEKKCNYSGTVDVLAAEEPDATLELEFEGTLIGIYAIVGTDAGAINVSVDDGTPKRMDMFDSFCKQFHRPVCYVFGESLDAGKHVLRITVLPENNPESTGHAVRIVNFVAN